VTVLEVEEEEIVYKVMVEAKVERTIFKAEETINGESIFKVKETVKAEGIFKEEEIIKA
jgi:hypothetical protein